MSDTSTARPRPVTTAGWLVVGGSVVAVLSAFDRVSSLHTLESREAVEELLADPPGSGLGVGVDQVLDVIRVLSMVSAACAVAAAILGVHALRRSRSARLALTVLAVPLFLTGMATGGLATALVVAATVMLWVQPARGWFRDGPSSLGTSSTQGFRDGPSSLGTSSTQGFRDGPSSTQGFRDGPSSLGTSSSTATAPERATPARPDETTAPVAPAPTRVAPPPEAARGESGGPREVEGFGTVAPSGALPHVPAPAHAHAAPAANAGGGTGPRPPALVWACALTWVFSGLAALGMLVSVAALLAAPDLVFDEVYRQNPDLEDAGMTRETLTTATYTLAAICVLWAVAASALAVLVFRGAGWARALLQVSSGLAGAFFLVTSLTSPVMVLPLAACLATMLLLARPEVRAWFSAGAHSPPRR